RCQAVSADTAENGGVMPLQSCQDRARLMRPEPLGPRLHFPLRPADTEMMLDANARSGSWPAGLGVCLRPLAEPRGEPGAARRPSLRPSARVPQTALRPAPHPD